MHAECALHTYLLDFTRWLAQINIQLWSYYVNMYLFARDFTYSHSVSAYVIAFRFLVLLLVYRKERSTLLTYLGLAIENDPTPQALETPFPSSFSCCLFYS